VNHDAAENLFGVFRRAVPLILVCMLAAAIVVNVQRQLSGPSYEASARVFLASRDLGAILTDTQSTYVDPQRQSENALALARSSALYESVAKAKPSLGTAQEIEAAVAVSGNPGSDVIDFVATAGRAPRAVATVNAVATGYVTFRAKVYASTTEQAIARLQERLDDPTANKTEVQALLDRLELEQTLGSGNALVIDPARSATKVSPAPVRDTVLGAAIGLVLALLIVGVRELMSTRVRSEADIEDVLDSPVVASIPMLPKAAGIVAIGRHEARFGDTYALLAASLEQDEEERKGREAMVIAVTSAVDGEGKTTTAANLAVAMAKRGLRVAIVDFDLRKPALGRIFGLPPSSEGVFQVVRSGRAIESVLWAYPINQNGTPPRRLPNTHFSPVKSPRSRVPLLVVPAGGPDRSGEVARSPKTGKMIAWLRQQTDVVILDTPPALLAVEMAELSASVDSVLVVVRQGRLTSRDLSHLARQSGSWKAKIRGVVLVGAPSSSERALYYNSD
jgi:succinoglycan biosynthesis transport protein ExoP